jgi:hypothetical protein
LSWDGSGHEWSAVCNGPTERLELAAEQVGGRIVEKTPLSLEQIFVARSTAHLQEA